MELERRFYPLTELRVATDGDEPRVEGYAAVFDQLSEDLGGFREQIDAGAFAGAIQGDVRSLWQHDNRYVLGRTKSGTLVLREDDTGLYYETTPPDAQWARDALASMDRGDVDQSSFGFRVASDTWEEGEDGVLIRTIHEVDTLFDVSPVTFPAYPQTSVQVRSIINDSGIDFDGLSQALTRTRAGLDLRDQDRDLLEATIVTLDTLLDGRAGAGRSSEPDDSSAGALGLLRRQLEIAERAI